MPLTITRKVGQRVYINGTSIIVYVKEIKDSRVILSFDADPSISIDREEVYLNRRNMNDPTQPTTSREATSGS